MAVAIRKKLLLMMKKDLYNPPWVRISPMWRRERDSNPRYPWGYARFPSVCLRPLNHLSTVYVAVYALYLAAPLCFCTISQASFDKDSSLGHSPQTALFSPHEYKYLVETSLFARDWQNTFYHNSGKIASVFCLKTDILKLFFYGACAQQRVQFERRGKQCKWGSLFGRCSLVWR